MSSDYPCHCHSQRHFANCCEPLLSGASKAQTAEQLMRSRFSAFCTGNIPYLIATHHPSKRQADDNSSLAETIAHCQWLRLEIISTRSGLANHSSGEVEYIATYTQQDTLSQLHENSRFVFEEEQWFYLDGDIAESPAPTKPGRNDPCWCGSQKKFKKCHG
ncbi:YchJ family protein [Oceanicoccus sagamiensis]|uniref:Zinc chelation protein SecC n=1 Tax=Oceanicoccus sagamiensis TaxID=716816 RepID=A0A1X9NFI5_9GAMM|nr:YchJ family protein [Oceanicoccus sagamiensis]ARN74635.1 zinc chelation protein SecC [Oceanicoccus sagamiensis]